MSDLTEDPVRKHLSEAGRKGGQNRWSPERRRTAAEREEERDRLARELLAQMLVINDRLATIEQLVA